MRRYTDFFLFLAFFLLSAFGWWMMEITGHMPAPSPKEIAPMTVAVVVILATPALLVVAILAFVRAAANIAATRFWGWALLASVLTGAALVGAKLMTDLQGIQLGFSFGVWFAAIIALSALVGWILGATQAVPVKVKSANVPNDGVARKLTRGRRGNRADETEAPARGGRGPSASEGDPSEVDPAGVEPGKVDQPEAAPPGGAPHRKDAPEKGVLDVDTLEAADLSQAPEKESSPEMPPQSATGSLNE